MVEVNSSINIKVMLFLSISLFLLMSHVMCEANKNTNIFQRQTRKRFCGRELTQILSSLCNYGYNGVQQKDKKSGKY